MFGFRLQASLFLILYKFAQKSKHAPMLHRRESLNRAVSIGADYACRDVRFRLTEPNDCSQAAAVDLWHLAHLLALFRLVVLIDADRIYPDGGCGSRIPESAKTCPQVDWNLEGLIVIDTDVHKLRIVGPTVRYCGVVWHMLDVVFLQCTRERIIVTAGVYGQDPYFASFGASFVKCRVDRKLRDVDQDPSAVCNVVVAVIHLIFVVSSDVGAV
jgi:hypothetical protein